MVFLWKTKFKIPYIAGIALISLVCFLIVYNSTQDSFQEASCNVKQQTPLNDSSSRECDLFSGRWVYDEKSYPLYNGTKCSFMFEQYACEKYGRPDLKYQNWRWQPHDCDLPRFNATAFLEKIRGKKVVFVGDSLNQNQWISLLCLIEASLPESLSTSFIKNENMLHIQSIDYNATIGFYWSPFLVESNNDHPVIHRYDERIVRISSIEKHARHWTDADILIFDSYIWWNTQTMTLLWGSFESSDAIYKKVEMKHRRYEMAISTWSDWLEFNINRTKTKLFFMSLSPTHEWDEDAKTDKVCYSETEPILKQGYRGIQTDGEMMRIAESAIRNLKTKGLNVQYMNITQLSDYRKDAHPSIYKKFNQDITEEKLGNPGSYSDCVHWCLPGVPDIWNEILYVYMMNY